MRRVIFEEKGGPEVLKFDGTTDAEEAITWMAYLNAYNLLTAPRGRARSSVTSHRRGAYQDQGDRFE
jgi:hypothetical protein